MVYGSRLEVVVVIGGGALDASACAAAPAGAFVIAADSGLDAALAGGLVPSLVVGDLDSVSAEGLAWATANSVPVERHPVDKSATDTELALRRAAGLAGASRVVMLSGMGDRFDHAIGAMTALGASGLASLDAVEAWFGPVEVHVVHPGRRVTIDGPPGRIFSVVALHGTCRGLDVLAARWPLRSATLESGSTLGISNEIANGAVAVTVADGVATVIVPPSPATSPAKARP